MIEVQIKDKELYERFKRYASYSSDITQVCSFRDELESMLTENGIGGIFKSQNTSKKSLPLLTITGRNIMKLEGAAPEMLMFVGVRSEFDPTIPLKYMEEVGMLVKNKLVQTSKKFDELYSKLGYNDKISSLVCANVKFSKIGKLTDYIDGDLTMRGMGFNDPKETDISFKQAEVRIVSPLKQSTSRYEYVNAQLLDGSNNWINLRFYAAPIIMKSIMFEENRINIACRKITEDTNGTLTTIDPLILPRGLNYFNVKSVGPKTRQIPADLWRNAYYEFMFRYGRE